MLLDLEGEVWGHRQANHASAPGNISTCTMPGTEVNILIHLSATTISPIFAPDTDIDTDWDTSSCRRSPWP